MLRRIMAERRCVVTGGPTRANPHLSEDYRDYEGPGVSPDRADAMVWALTELMLGKEPPEPHVRVL